MSERLKEVFRLPSMLFLHGSPVIIEAGALYKDNVTGRVLGQIKIRNLDERKLLVCKLSIIGREANGKELEVIPDYTYLDVNAASGQDFGTRVPIYFASSSIRRISVSVIETVFEDGSVWQHEPCEWETISPQKTLYEYFQNDPELEKQYQLAVGKESRYVPSLDDDLFRCTCGTVNRASARKCTKCGWDYESLMAALDLETLTKKKGLRIKTEIREREEKERKEKIIAEKKKKKRKITLAIVIPLVIAGITLAALYPSVIKPAMEQSTSYKSASHLLQQGAYDEAKAAFEQLGDYKNSQIMVRECTYQKAEDLNSRGEYDNAITEWESISDYLDSSKRIETAKADKIEQSYQEAQSLMEEGKYVDASNAFTAVGDYKDSSVKAQECLSEEAYHQAINLKENGEMYKAYNAFCTMKDYKDCSEIIDSILDSYPQFEWKVGDIVLFGKLSNYTKANPNTVWEGSTENDIKWIVLAEDDNFLLISQNCLFNARYSQVEKDISSNRYFDFFSDREKHNIDSIRILSSDEVKMYNENIELYNATDLSGNEIIWWTSSGVKSRGQNCFLADGTLQYNTPWNLMLGVRLAVVVRTEK